MILLLAREYLAESLQKRYHRVKARNATRWCSAGQTFGDDVERFECWRVCWIPDPGVDVDNFAETSETLPKSEAQSATPMKSASEKKSSPYGSTPSKINPTWHDMRSVTREMKAVMIVGTVLRMSKI